MKQTGIDWYRVRRVVWPFLVLALAVGLAAAGPAAAQEHAAEGGEGGLFSINFGLMVWTWVIFALLLFVLGKWAWGPILGALNTREERIQESLDEAARQREEANRLLREHRKQLEQAREEAQEILADGRKAAEKIRSEMVQEAEKQRESILDRARADIERERDRALDTLRREAVDLSISAASRVLQRSLDSEENRRLVEEYLERLTAETGGDGAS